MAWRIDLPRGGRRREHGAMAERFEVSRDGTTLAGERWPGGGPTVLLLHEGVADRRGWAEVAGPGTRATVVAYDRRVTGRRRPARSRSLPGRPAHRHRSRWRRPGLAGRRLAGGGLAPTPPWLPPTGLRPGSDGHRGERRPRTRARRRYQAARAAAGQGLRGTGRRRDQPPGDLAVAGRPRPARGAGGRCRAGAGARHERGDHRQRRAGDRGSRWRGRLAPPRRDQARSPSHAAISTCLSWWTAAACSRPGFPLPGTTS